MKKDVLTQPRRWLCWLLGLGLIGANNLCAAEPSAAEPVAATPPPTATGTQTAPPAASSAWPMLLGAQYTFIVQNQSRLHSPYSGSLSLDPSGDTQPTHTIGIYLGWAPVSWGQLYLDVEKAVLHRPQLCALHVATG
jgi:hypothetical protein